MEQRDVPGIFDILFCVQAHIKELARYHNSTYVALYGDDAIGELHQNHGAVVIIPLTENVQPGPGLDCAQVDKLQFAVSIATYHADDHAKLAAALQEIGEFAREIVDHMKKFSIPKGVKKVVRVSPLRPEGMNGWILYPLIYEAELVV
jgi:hypothetical protein